jgi:DNA repair exonuclease SbcCD ATPase subunit
MITDLVMMNYRQFAYQELQFSPGLNVIRGMNNAGKTTIQEAIAFALFGPSAIRDTAKSWVREGSKTGSVTLLMEVSGDRIKIMRSNTGAKLWINDVEETQYRKEATAAIAERLGLSPATFLLGYNIRQKEIDFFSSLTKGRRRAEIERLLSISRVDNAISIVKGKVATTNALLDGLVASFSGIEERRFRHREVVKGIDDTDAALVEAEKFLAVQEAEAVELYRQQEALHKDQITIKGLETRKDSLTVQLGFATNLLQTLDENIKRAEALIEDRETRLLPALARKEIQAARLEELREKQSKHKTYVALAKQGAPLETAKTRTAKAVEEAKGKMLWNLSRAAKIKALEEQLNGYDGAKNAQEQARLRALCDEARGSKKTLVEARSRFLDETCCPIGGPCDSAVSPKKRAEDAAANIAELEKDYTSWDWQLQALIEEAAVVQPTLAEIARLKGENDRNHITDEEISELEKAAQMAADAYEEHKKYLLDHVTDFSEYDLEKAEKSMKATLQLVDEYNGLLHLEHAKDEQVKRWDEVALEKGGLEQDIAALEEQLSRYTDSQATYASIMQAIQGAKEVIDSQRKVVSGLQVQRASLVSERNSLQEKIAEQESLQGKINVAQQDLDFAEADILAFRQFKKYVGEKVLPKVREVAASMFHTITHHRYKQLFISEDYEMKVLTHEGSFRSLKSISGSEEDVALLCLRLALSTLAVGTNRAIDFLMLDEITASFDNERTDSTVQGLLALRKLYRQIFWITHKEVEEQYADRRFVVALVDGKATVEVL